MNYKIVEGLFHPADSEKNCPVYKVTETATSQVVKIFMDPRQAKEYLRHLNFGGGFDGWTPSFMLKKAVIEPQNT
jgi:hypothetical protein